MDLKQIESIITEEFISGLFPPEKTDEFFNALYGGAETGAFDISLHLDGVDRATNSLMLEFWLTERPGKCMACNLTYGLPQVFDRHPVIDIKGISAAIEKVLAPEISVKGWQIGTTEPRNPTLSVIPLRISLGEAG